MVKKNACVFISGKGSNLKNLLKRSRDYNFPVSIKLVVSNNPKAKGINIAKKYSIPYLIVNTKLRNCERSIYKNLKIYKINIICLAGYMKIISKNFLRLFKKNNINIHPSLLPKFKGLNTFKRILEEKEVKTGCTVHYVNEKLDGGMYLIVLPDQKWFDIIISEQKFSFKTSLNNLIGDMRFTNSNENTIYPL